jgi:hypothetical protein
LTNQYQETTGGTSDVDVEGILKRQEQEEDDEYEEYEASFIEDDQ